MHEDANASAPDFDLGMMFCKEKTFGCSVTSVARVTWIGQEGEIGVSVLGKRCLSAVKRLLLK